MSGFILGRRGCLAGLASLAAIRTARAAETVRIGLLHTLSPAPFYIAQEKGYFRDQGLNVDFRFFQAAQPIAAAAVAGDIDIGATALTGGFFNLAGRGVLKVIGGGLHEEKGYELSAILVSEQAYKAGLTSVDKLGGHSFGITQYGSSFHYMLGRLADVAHFDLKTVSLRPLQSITNMVAAVKTGQVDATIAIASMARPVEAAGQAKIIGWVGDYVPYQITAVFTTERMIRDHADTLRSFGKTYQRAVDEYSDAFLRKDSAGKPVTDAKTDAAVAAVEKYVFTGDPNARAKILAGVGYYSPHGGLDVADVRRQLAWFEAQGLVKTHIDPAAMIDTDFIPPMNAT